MNEGLNREKSEEKNESSEKETREIKVKSREGTEK